MRRGALGRQKPNGMKPLRVTGVTGSRKCPATVGAYPPKIAVWRGFSRSSSRAKPNRRATWTPAKIPVDSAGCGRERRWHEAGIDTPLPCLLFVRATYGAAAQLIGVEPISMGARLGPRRAEASWIVSAESGLPTGYSPQETHPALTLKSDIIRDGADLLQRLNVWRVSNKPRPEARTSERVIRPWSFIIVGVLMLLLSLLYLVGGVLSGGDSSSPRSTGFLGFACLFAAYGLSLIRLRHFALPLGWAVVAFSAFWVLFYPAPIAMFAWVLHLWFVFRLRNRKAILG